MYIYIYIHISYLYVYIYIYLYSYVYMLICIHKYICISDLGGVVFDLKKIPEGNVITLPEII